MNHLSFLTLRFSFAMNLASLTESSDSWTKSFSDVSIYVCMIYKGLPLPLLLYNSSRSDGTPKKKKNQKCCESNLRVLYNTNLYYIYRIYFY